VTPLVPDAPPERRLLVAVPPDATGACLIRRAARFAAAHGYVPEAVYVSARVLTGREFAGLRAAMAEARALGVPFEQIHHPDVAEALAVHAAPFEVVVVGHACAGQLEAHLACEAAPTLSPGSRLLVMPVRAEAPAEPAGRLRCEAL
jgi:K+-sensing histidine kinase KdpD